MISVCDYAKKSCPVFLDAAQRLHRSFEDPAGLTGSEEKRLALFRRVHDEVRDYLRDFAQQNAAACDLERHDLRRA